VASFTPVGATLVLILALQLWTIHIGPMPLWPLLTFVAKIIGAIMFRFTTRRAPRIKLPLVCIAFLVAILWIYVTANELVALLRFFGTLFGISGAVLGLTVLA
jgi:sodium/potassium/calcium exchanger 6